MAHSEIEHQANEKIQYLGSVLSSEKKPLALRFRALFSLKHVASQKPDTPDTIHAIRAIAAAFLTPSDLLKHELAYCLGQTANVAAAPFLLQRLQDPEESAICRHEAAEGLAALGHTDSVDLLRKLSNDQSEERVVRETCEIAVSRLEWQLSPDAEQERLRQSDFASIDPAPPLPQTSETPSLSELEETLLDASLPLFRRYRAMFSLRDLCSPPGCSTAIPAIEALARGLDDQSALFRHEIAFVFGQLSHPASISSLFRTLSNKNEMGMVRHEAAEALGSLGDENGVEDMLKQFLDDEEQVVKESIVVALDMAECEKNGELEYALVPDVEVGCGTAIVASA